MEEPQNQKPHTKGKKTPELIGQGSYGCVFYPGIACSGKTETVQYVTKVQKASQQTEHEHNIGNHIRKKKITKYYDYFAPVIKTCPIKMASIEKDEINRCDVLQKAQEEDPNTEFTSIKIRYVGKQTLKEHILERLLTDTPTFFGHMLETELYLLHSLEKLVKANIIHYDLKSNNIMFHEKIQNPVIIDFGMSVIMEKLTKEAYASTFFDHYEKYAPWCIDIVLLSYLVKDPEWIKTKVTTENANMLDKHIETFFGENPVMVHCSKNTNLSKQMKQIKQYWKQWVTTNTNKTKEKAITQLLEYWKTWDTYSLLVIYYRFMKENVKMEETAPFVDTYLEMHEYYLLCKPSERKLPQEMYKKFLEYSKSIQKKEYLQWNRKMSEYQKKPEIIEDEKSSVIQDLKENKEIENKLYKKKQEKHKPQLQP